MARVVVLSLWGEDGGKKMMEPEIIYAATDDGWRLALCHWAPHGPQGQKKRCPVLMIHGLGANRLNMDLDDRYSIARAAARRGFDVYILELRGAGLSRAPLGRDRARYSWGFSDYADRDVPVAIACVLERTGAVALHGVGHSMGGMLLYAQGARQAPELRSICAIGSPLLGELNLGRREKRVLQLAARLAPAGLQARVPIRRLMRTAGRFVSVSTRLVNGILLNAENAEPEVLERLAKEGLDDIPTAIILEITAQMACPADVGPYGYEAAMAAINVPVFALGGSNDRIAPPESVSAAVARMTTPDLRFREMGLRYGDQSDYGHVDLLVGRLAPDEVFPQVLDFLEEVD